MPEAKDRRPSRFLPAPGPENSPVYRGSGSVLPSWYPVKPLEDITAIMRAIEEGRAFLGDNKGQQTGNPFPDPFGAHLEDPAGRIKLQTLAGSLLPKILLDITNQPEGESALLTPQKKPLLNIDKVEKDVQEELPNLERTPSAKKAAREKRVRTLMSMR